MVVQGSPGQLREAGGGPRRLVASGLILMSTPGRKDRMNPGSHPYLHHHPSSVTLACLQQKGPRAAAQPPCPSILLGSDRPNRCCSEHGFRVLAAQDLREPWAGRE